MANQSKTKSHISYYITAKSHITHMGTHEQYPISSKRASTQQVTNTFVA